MTGSNHAVLRSYALQVTEALRCRTTHEPLQKSRRVWLDRFGHWPWLEHPDALEKTTAEFLAELSAAAQPAHSR